MLPSHLPLLYPLLRLVLLPRSQPQAPHPLQLLPHPLLHSLTLLPPPLPPTHLHLLEEAEKRDHRRLAKQLNLFHMQDEAPGMVFWHANGWVIWQAIEQYMRALLTEANYREVKTPQVMVVLDAMRQKNTLQSTRRAKPFTPTTFRMFLKRVARRNPLVARTAR